MVELLPASSKRRIIGYGREGEESGGDGGIRTLGTLIEYGSLAGNWFQPLTHVSAIARALLGGGCEGRAIARGLARGKGDDAGFEVSGTLPCWIGNRTRLAAFSIRFVVCSLP